MIKEAIDRILQLASPNTQEHHGVTWTDKPLTPIKPLTPDTFRLQTLDGFIDLVKAPIDGVAKENYVIHVDSPVRVALRQRVSEMGMRLTPLEAIYQPASISFGTFLPPESFIIMLQSQFQDEGDIGYVLEMASNLRDEKVGTSTDDGVSQTVTVRAGVALKENVEVKRSVTLAPRRTFTEVSQPASDFVLRLRTGRDGQLPSLALFEADGGEWKTEAIDNIAEYIKQELAEHTIVS